VVLKKQARVIKKLMVCLSQTNCLTEVFFDDAVKQAEQLDEYYRQHGKLFGPLHGVPVTLKDQFDVQGADTTLGYVWRAFKPATKDATVVEILKSRGAIILAKTNIPQSIMVTTASLTFSFGAYGRLADFRARVLVVRDREPPLGPDGQPSRPQLHPWRLDGRRGRVARPQGVHGRLGHGHWRVDPDPGTYERVVGAEADSTCDVFFVHQSFSSWFSDPMYRALGYLIKVSPCRPRDKNMCHPPWDP
jgi:hypothetical protein